MKKEFFVINKILYWYFHLCNYVGLPLIMGLILKIIVNLILGMETVSLEQSIITIYIVGLLNNSFDKVYQLYKWMK